MGDAHPTTTEQEKVATGNDQKQYDELNFHDHQFDLSDAFLSIAIAMLAVTSLVQKRWLFGVNAAFSLFFPDLE